MLSCAMHAPVPMSVPGPCHAVVCHACACAYVCAWPVFQLRVTVFSQFDWLSCVGQRSRPDQMHEGQVGTWGRWNPIAMLTGNSNVYGQ